jgi:predicted RNase H-like HicB family nuclease
VAATLAGYYSAKLNGKSYSGNVEESDGTYTASVMTVPISVASGPSIDLAESNLTVVIDALA